MKKLFQVLRFLFLFPIFLIYKPIKFIWLVLDEKDEKTSDKLRAYSGFLGLLLSAGAIFFAKQSFDVSQQSLRKSMEALEWNKTQFDVINEPKLNCFPYKDKENYINIDFDQKLLKIKFNAVIMMINNGRTSAQIDEFKIMISYLNSDKPIEKIGELDKHLTVEANSQQLWPIHGEFSLTSRDDFIRYKKDFYNAGMYLINLRITLKYFDSYNGSKKTYIFQGGFKISKNDYQVVNFGD